MKSAHEANPLRRRVPPALTRGPEGIEVSCEEGR